MTLTAKQLDALPVGSKAKGLDLGYHGDKGKRPFHKLGCSECGNTRWVENRGKLLPPKICGPCNKARSKASFKIQPREVYRAI